MCQICRRALNVPLGSVARTTREMQAQRIEILIGATRYMACARCVGVVLEFVDALARSAA